MYGPLVQNTGISHTSGWRIHHRPSWEGQSESNRHEKESANQISLKPIHFNEYKISIHLHQDKETVSTTIKGSQHLSICLC